MHPQNGKKEPQIPCVNDFCLIQEEKNSINGHVPSGKGREKKKKLPKFYSVHVNIIYFGISLGGGTDWEGGIIWKWREIWANLAFPSYRKGAVIASYVNLYN